MNESERSLEVNPKDEFNSKDYRRINESELSGKTQDSFFLFL